MKTLVSALTLLLFFASNGLSQSPLFHSPGLVRCVLG